MAWPITINAAVVDTAVSPNTVVPAVKVVAAWRTTTNVADADMAVSLNTADLAVKLAAAWLTTIHAVVAAPRPSPNKVVAAWDIARRKMTVADRSSVNVVPADSAVPRRATTASDGDRVATVIVAVPAVRRPCNAALKDAVLMRMAVTAHKVADQWVRCSVVRKHVATTALADVLQWDRNSAAPATTARVGLVRATPVMAVVALAMPVVPLLWSNGSIGS